MVADLDQVYTGNFIVYFQKEIQYKTNALLDVRTDPIFFTK